jgi:LPS-assembly lipoprotein
MKRPAIVLLLLLFTVTLASACGWRLRGTMTLPEGLNTIYLNNQAESPILPRMLETLLTANQVNVTDSASAAQLIINILSYREERRVVSVGANTLVTEYELNAQANFSIEDAEGNIVLPPSDASVIRNYVFDQNNVLGKEEEERLIQSEMRRDIAQQIVRRLRFLDLQ